MPVMFAVSAKQKSCDSLRLNRLSVADCIAVISLAQYIGDREEVKVEWED
jgi:hypothetical protein